ncbi:hypothetical protein TD95_004787 [Thielaviopsis punctulata]|uniref:Uncharacterized protein n=1 Tax=Thielaviopsis punctulata TaxID=72032 RepID=A0A0F4ZGH9_9PEZI|nr:hypothetical protein TD95_004787 [Thielaviopsis punctulata]
MIHSMLSSETSSEQEIGFFGPVTPPPVKVFHPPRLQQPEIEDGEADADGEADEEIVPKKEDSDDVSMQETTTTTPIDDAAARKRPLSTQTSNAAKKPKLKENGDNDSAMVMEVDNVDGIASNHAYPSPLEGDEAPAPQPHTNGPDQGTQETSKDLTLDTVYLDLALDKLQSENTMPMRTADHASQPSPMLLMCEWSPTNPNVLAAAGTESISRLYTLTPGSVDNKDMAKPVCKLLEEDCPPDTQVTAMSWSHSENNALAIATERGGKARINIWAGDGTHVQAIDIAEGAIIKLVWNKAGSTLLAISPSTENGTLLSVFKAPALAPISYTIANHDLAAMPLDVTWTNDSTFLVCGGQMLQAFTCTDSSIEPAKKFETDPSTPLCNIAYDDRALIAAASSDNGTITLIDANGNSRRISAHTHPISALKWQPETLPGSENRLLASAGEDGALLLWDPKSLDTKPKKFLTMSGGPIVALSFSPDGLYLAGATALYVYVWKVDDAMSIPYAKWKRTPHAGWGGPTPPGENEDTVEHCLAWDCTGQKIAYGVNSRLAVIRLR